MWKLEPESPKPCFNPWCQYLTKFSDQAASQGDVQGLRHEPFHRHGGGSRVSAQRGRNLENRCGVASWESQRWGFHLMGWSWTASILLRFGWRAMVETSEGGLRWVKWKFPAVDAGNPAPLEVGRFFSVEIVGFICSKHQPRGHGCIEPGALWLLMSQWWDEAAWRHEAEKSTIQSFATGAGVGARIEGWIC